jgi:hypothetical protein
VTRAARRPSQPRNGVAELAAPAISAAKRVLQPIVAFDDEGRFVSSSRQTAERQGDQAFPAPPVARPRRQLAADRRSCCAPTTTITAPRFLTGVERSVTRVTAGALDMCNETPPFDLGNPG